MPRSKGDRNLEGRSYTCPALSRLCPVEAVEDWLALSKLTAGPLFRKIDRWGHLSEAELTPSSIIPMLRKLLSQAGVADAEAFSSHSLRRGFAQWAGMSGWDIRELMNYVGWRDVKAAMRYLDGVSSDQKERFERGLDRALSEKLPAPTPQLPNLPEVAFTTIEVSIDLSAFNGGSRRAVANALRDMASTCLARFQAHPWTKMATATGFPFQHHLSISWTTISTRCSTNSIALPTPVNVSWRQFAAIQPAAGTGTNAA